MTHRSIRQGQDFTAHFESAPYNKFGSLWRLISENEIKTLNLKQKKTKNFPNRVQHFYQIMKITLNFNRFQTYSPLDSSLHLEVLQTRFRRVRYLINLIKPNDYLIVLRQTPDICSISNSSLPPTLCGKMS